MQKTQQQRLLSLLLCIVLIAAMALLATGCSDKKETPKTPATTTQTEATKGILEEVPTQVTEKGEGKTAFNFEVTDLDGKTTKFLVKTDKTIVGEALLEVGLIAGEEGPYGLMVSSVNGISADYNKDKAYWAFYANGEYATKGVDQTEIDPTATYAFVKEVLNPNPDRYYMTYRYEHTLRVAYWETKIAEGEGWNSEPLLIACLLHDVGYPFCKDMIVSERKQ